MECDVVSNDGSVSKISFAIPENEEIGVNPYFDYILSNYHLSEIRATYEAELKEHRNRQRHNQLAEQRQKEAKELAQLFDAKEKVLELIEAQKQRLDLLEKQHIENAQAIGQLQGEISAYKKIPLENIAKSIKQIAETNKQILQLVKEK